MLGQPYKQWYRQSFMPSSPRREQCWKPYAGCTRFNLGPELVWTSSYVPEYVQPGLCGSVCVPGLCLRAVKQWLTAFWCLCHMNRPEGPLPSGLKGKALPRLIIWLMRLEIISRCSIMNGLLRKREHTSALCGAAMHEIDDIQAAFRGLPVNFHY